MVDQDALVHGPKIGSMVDQVHFFVSLSWLMVEWVRNAMTGSSFPLLCSPAVGLSPAVSSRASARRRHRKAEDGFYGFAGSQRGHWWTKDEAKGSGGQCVRSSGARRW